MKKATSLFIAFIAVSIYSSFSAIGTTAQTSFNQYVVNTDTAATRKPAPSFALQLLKDSSTQKFILVINNPLAEKLQVSISATSTPGFRDQIDGVAYRKRIDMSGAADDYYTITVRNKTQQVTRHFQLQTNADNNRSIIIE